jgi:hypothetical protein
MVAELDRLGDRGRQLVLPIAALTAELGDGRVEQLEGIGDP